MLQLSTSLIPLSIPGIFLASHIPSPCRSCRLLLLYQLVVLIFDSYHDIWLIGQHLFVCLDGENSLSSLSFGAILLIYFGEYFEFRSRQWLSHSLSSTFFPAGIFFNVRFGKFPCIMRSLLVFTLAVSMSSLVQNCIQELQQDGTFTLFNTVVRSQLPKKAFIKFKIINTLGVDPSFATVQTEKGPYVEKNKKYK